MTDNSFHQVWVMETACTQTITILYKYFCIWELNLRLNNIIYYSLFFIINLHHYCHYYWTSELLLNLWECTQDSDITNKWVVHFVILCSEQQKDMRASLIGKSWPSICKMSKTTKNTQFNQKKLLVARN